MCRLPFLFCIRPARLCPRIFSLAVSKNRLYIINWMIFPEKHILFPPSLLRLTGEPKKPRIKR